MESSAVPRLKECEPAIGWQLPSFYCPLDSAIHAEAAKLERDAIAWADTIGLYTNDVERAWGIATHSADFSCRVIPHGRSDILLLFIKWNLWAFSIDDCHDTGGRPSAHTAHLVDLNARLVRTLETPGCGHLHLGQQTAALNDLVAQTRSLMTPFQLRRFAEGVRDWLFGTTWQVGNTERGVMPNINDYLGMRPSVNGTRFSVTFCEIANGIELHTDVLYSAPVQALIDMAGFIVSCDNDLFSYAKEEEPDGMSQNIVNIVARRDSCAPKDAVMEALAIRDHTMTLFLKLRERLSKTGVPDLSRYLESLSHYISGSIRWMSHAPRYASPRNRNEIPIPGACFQLSWSERPVVTGSDLLAIPVIAFWQSSAEARFDGYAYAGPATAVQHP